MEIGLIPIFCQINVSGKVDKNFFVKAKRKIRFSDLFLAFSFKVIPHAEM